ncbi:MAG: hypothetical protein KJ799_18785 [Bacteroidetes bacterium]|nr:hypothetical protein [Bacteroidota bacterium]MBU1677601.1 hypothetical protein [Bacteroidota bacterium]MBU2508744.1 hypothetical protein [Bacteroidota bacterium]
MKHLTIPILLLLFIFINGCDNSVGPTPPKTSGENTINTKVVNSKYTGFSFSQGGNIEYPNSNNITPDIIVLVQTNETGNILGVFFSSAGTLKPTFKLIRQFNDADTDSAQVYFDNLIEVPDSNYMNLALPVKVNQIWAVKTVDDKFGKILILHTEAYADSSNPSSPTLYGEASFKWNYQPNGSRNF